MTILVIVVGPITRIEKVIFKFIEFHWNVFKMLIVIEEGLIRHFIRIITFWFI